VFLFWFDLITSLPVSFVDVGIRDVSVYASNRFTQSYRFRELVRYRSSFIQRFSLRSDHTAQQYCADYSMLAWGPGLRTGTEHQECEVVLRQPQPAMGQGEACVCRCRSKLLKFNTLEPLMCLQLITWRYYICPRHNTQTCSTVKDALTHAIRLVRNL
jgi:hypothetical protein